MAEPISQAAFATPNPRLLLHRKRKRGRRTGIASFNGALVISEAVMRGLHTTRVVVSETEAMETNAKSQLQPSTRNFATRPQRAHNELTSKRNTQTNNNNCIYGMCAVTPDAQTRRCCMGHINHRGRGQRIKVLVDGSSM